jgi:hypothetical protein
MPGPPGYGLHQPREASPQAAKPEHAIEKDAASARSVLDERKDIGAQNSRSYGGDLYPVGFPRHGDYPLMSSPAVLSMWAGMRDPDVVVVDPADDPLAVDVAEGGQYLAQAHGVSGAAAPAGVVQSRR